MAQIPCLRRPLTHVRIRQCCYCHHRFRCRFHVGISLAPSKPRCRYGRRRRARRRHLRASLASGRNAFREYPVVCIERQCGLVGCVGCSIVCFIGTRRGGPSDHRTDILNASSPGKRLWDQNMDRGNVPQWITAVVAFCAATVAAIGIAIQYRLARRRAAVDFFLKTEADKHLLDAWDEFWAAIRYMETMSIDDFCTREDGEVRKHYFAVRRYLNVHELLAVGIANRMFDNRVCYDFWSGVLVESVEAARPLIDHLRKRPGWEEKYIELDRLYRNWKAQVNR